MNGRKTGGRSAGTPNKATAEIRDLARADGPAVFKELVRLAIKSKSARAASMKVDCVRYVPSFEVAPCLADGEPNVSTSTSVRSGWHH